MSISIKRSHDDISVTSNQKQKRNRIEEDFTDILNNYIINPINLQDINVKNKHNIINFIIKFKITSIIKEYCWDTKKCNHPQCYIPVLLDQYNDQEPYIDSIVYKMSGNNLLVYDIFGSKNICGKRTYMYDEVDYCYICSIYPIDKIVWDLELSLHNSNFNDKLHQAIINGQDKNTLIKKIYKKINSSLEQKTTLDIIRDSLRPFCSKHLPKVYQKNKCFYSVDDHEDSCIHDIQTHNKYPICGNHHSHSANQDDNCEFKWSACNNCSKIECFGCKFESHHLARMEVNMELFNNVLGNVATPNELAYCLPLFDHYNNVCIECIVNHIFDSSSKLLSDVSSREASLLMGEIDKKKNLTSIPSFYTRRINILKRIFSSDDVSSAIVKNGISIKKVKFKLCVGSYDKKYILYYIYERDKFIPFFCHFIAQAVRLYDVLTPSNIKLRSFVSSFLLSFKKRTNKDIPLLCVEQILSNIYLSKKLI